MIVGFDHDDTRIFKAQHEFLRQTDIMHAMVGMLSAIPKTPLHARLKNEGRLDLRTTNNAFGTNVIPLGMTREELRDGYIGLMQELYDPDFYFERLENLFYKEIRLGTHSQCLLAQTPWRKLKSQSVDAVLATGLFLRLMKNIPDPELRRIYRRRMATMPADGPTQASCSSA